MPGETPVRYRPTLEVAPGSGAAARPKCPDPGLVIPGGRTGHTGRQGRDVTPLRFVGHGWRERGDRGRFNGCLKFELAGYLVTGNGISQSPPRPLFFTSSPPSSLSLLYSPLSLLPFLFRSSFSLSLYFFTSALLDSISDILTRVALKATMAGHLESEAAR